MKITITPADKRLCSEALSHCGAARQWLSILDSAGLDTKDEADQIAADERIAQGMLSAMERIEGEPL